MESIVVALVGGAVTLAGVLLANSRTQASVEAKVEDGGRIGQLVWDSNIAWSLGNFDANRRSINIEHANRESRKERFEV